jgi:Nif-specific regulatory protein
VVEPAPAAAAPQSRESDRHAPALTKSSLKEMEKESIIQALIENRGIQTKAAAQLGMTARQIGYKVRKYGIDL